MKKAFYRVGVLLFLLLGMLSTVAQAAPVPGEKAKTVIEKFKVIGFLQGGASVGTPSDKGEFPVIEPSTIQPDTPISAVPLSTKEQIKIVVDAGHGGTDPGAIGNGLREKDLTLSISQKVAENLRADPKFDVVMTREGDTFPKLPERVKIANGGGADLFISVHINSATASAKGTETYYKSEKSKLYANTVHKYLIQATGFADRKVKQAGFQVIRDTKMPAILVEIGFITNPAEAQQMADEEFQKQVADALYKGIREFVDQN